MTEATEIPDDAPIPELTYAELEAERDRLATELYQAGDRLAFVREMLGLQSVSYVPVKDVLRWLDGPKQGAPIVMEET